MAARELLEKIKRRGIYFVEADVLEALIEAERNGAANMLSDILKILRWQAGGLEVEADTSKQDGDYSRKSRYAAKELLRMADRLTDDSERSKLLEHLK